MENENIKEWAILFYMNGNNELQPEIIQALHVITLEGSDEYVDVLVQHSIIESSVVSIIRPQCYFRQTIEDFIGAHRYHVSGLVDTSFEKLTEDSSGYLGSINMADPKSLYGFIEWGMENYPAKHYMLVLGGHIFQYIGLMPDYSQGKPFLMGYPEMAKVLELVNEKLGKKIDLLILDTCYANRLEMLYELGKKVDPPVSYMVTYTSGGPIGGLAYDCIIQSVKAHSAESNPRSIACKIIENLDNDLIVYEIDHQKLEDIKQLYSSLAHCRLEHPASACSSPSELLTNMDESLPWHSVLKNIVRSMPSLTVCFKSASSSPFGHFYVSAQVITSSEKAKLYRKLAFSKGNYWADLLAGTNQGTAALDRQEISLEPIVLKPSDLFALVAAMNPDLSVDENRRILDTLIQYKDWS